MPTWIKLEDTMPEHYKYLGLSDAAFATQIRAICYSSRLATDGFIPEQAIAHLTRVVPEDDIEPRQVIAELLANEIWHMANEICHEVPSGYVIHDFDQYQQTKTSKEDLSKKRARAGALGAKARWQTNGKDSGLPDSNMASDGRKEKIREDKKREDKSKARATSVPENFTPTEDQLLAIKTKYPDLDIPAETSKFLDHHRAKGSTFKDWTAAWRKWMAQAETYRVRDAKVSSNGTYRNEDEWTPAERGLL